jgi:hypothetical protein
MRPVFQRCTVGCWERTDGQLYHRTRGIFGSSVSGDDARNGIRDGTAIRRKIVCRVAGVETVPEVLVRYQTKKQMPAAAIKPVPKHKTKPVAPARPKSKAKPLTIAAPTKGTRTKAVVAAAKAPVSQAKRALQKRRLLLPVADPAIAPLSMSCSSACSASSRAWFVTHHSEKVGCSCKV